MFWDLILHCLSGPLYQVTSYARKRLKVEGYPCWPPTLQNKVGRVPFPKLGTTLIRVPTVRTFKGCFKDVLRMLYGCFKDVLRKFQGCSKEVSRMFSDC